MSNDKPDAPEGAADGLAENLANKGPAKTIDLEAKEVVASADVPSRDEVADLAGGVEDTVAGPTDDDGLEDEAARLRIESASSRAGDMRASEPDHPAMQSDTPAERQFSPLTPPAPKRGSSFGGTLVGAVVGSVLSFAGLGAMNATGVLQNIPGFAGLLGGMPASEPAAPQIDVASLENRLAAIEASADRAQPADVAVDPARVEGLEARLSAVEAEASAIKEQIAGLGSAGSQTPSSVGEPQSGLLITQVEQLAGRMYSAEKAIADLGAKPTVQGDAPAAPTADAAGMSELQNGLVGAQEKITALSGRLDKVEESVAGYGEAQAKTADVARLAATMRALSGLETAFREGKPYGEFLAQIEADTGENSAVQALKANGESGIANEASLIAELDAITPAILAGSAQEPQGVFGKILSNAKNLVVVRPEGPVEGSTPDAIVSRIRAAVETGDLPVALLLWKGLPEVARAASEEWVKRVQLRLDGAKSIRMLADELGQEKAG